MSLPTQRIDPESTNPNRLIIFSPPKHGKTTLISELDNCLLIDLENGSNFVSALKVQVNSLTELQDLGNEIMKAGRPYKYIAIDTVTALENWAEWDATEDYMNQPIGKAFNRDPKEVTKLLPRNQWKSVLTLPNGAGYMWLRLSMTNWINRLSKLAPHIILIGHLKEKMIEFQGKEVSQKALDLTGKIASITCANADAIAYLYRDEEGIHLNFAANDTTLCGARPEHLRGKDIVVAENKEDGTTTYHWDRIFKQ